MCLFFLSFFLFANIFQVAYQAHSIGELIGENPQLTRADTYILPRALKLV